MKSASTWTSPTRFSSCSIPKAIGQSLEGVERVARLVSAMKEFAHPGSRQMQAIDLNRALESTLAISRNEWKYTAIARSIVVEKHGGTIHFETAPEAGTTFIVRLPVDDRAGTRDPEADAAGRVVLSR